MKSGFEKMGITGQIGLLKCVKRMGISVEI